MDCRSQYGLFLILVFFIAKNEGSKSFIVQTVQSDDGQTFDCFDINKQPALNHPSLKTHKIQLRPSSYPSAMNEEEYSSSNSSLEVQMTKISCPLGTSPILRDNQHDTKRFPVSPMFTNASINNSEKMQIHKVKLNRYGFIIYGTKGSVSVYEPDLSARKGYRFTGALLQISYQNEGILVGWALSPTESGDNYVHMYSEWGNFDHPCKTFDQQCHGFVQVRPDFAFGALLRPVSTYNGEQYHITLTIFKDPKTENWWLNYGKKGTPVGYWPKSIFTLMADKADSISWGGFVHSTLDEPSPPMGSGHFASEGLGKAALFEDINFLNDKNKWLIPTSLTCVTEVFNQKCYTLSDWSMPNTGTSFYFGGPGGCKG